MSRIYFHSKSGESEVSGMERAFMGHLCNGITETILMVYDEKSPVLKFVDPGCYLKTRPAPRDFAETFKCWFNHGDKAGFTIDGTFTPSFTISLNTGLAVGNQAVKLAARLHGQCEIHCWVEGQNRKWLASIIADGLSTGIFRERMGWEAVIEHLGQRDDEPVVCSYSVCEQFPNAGIAGWVSKTDDDWYELPDEERWELAMKGLRQTSAEMKPENFATYRFRNGTTAMDVLRAANKEPRDGKA